MVQQLPIKSGQMRKALFTFGWN